MTKRIERLQERIMGDVFGNREAGEPLSAFDIARELDPDKITAHGTLYRPLSKLATAGQLEVVELPQTFVDDNGESVHYRGYQKPVDIEL